MAEKNNNHMLWYVIDFDINTCLTFHVKEIMTKKNVKRLHILIDFVINAKKNM